MDENVFLTGEEMKSLTTDELIAYINLLEIVQNKIEALA